MSEMPPPEVRRRRFEDLTRGTPSFVRNGREWHSISRIKGDPRYLDPNRGQEARNARQMLIVLGWPQDDGVYHLLCTWDDEQEVEGYQLVSDEIYHQWIHEAGVSEVSPN